LRGFNAYSWKPSRACSFVSFAEATPYDLDSPAEGMHSRSVVFTPTKKNNQALATGHDQCTTQFAFLHRQLRIDFADDPREEPGELFLCFHNDIARERFVQRQSPTRIGEARVDGSLTIVFFRHDDGSWNVFPANRSAPAMHAYPLAA
jgi:hypothetical protein